MKIKSFLIIVSSFTIFTGCATTAGALRNENVLNNFTVEKNYKIVTEQLNDMIKLCLNNKLYNIHKEYYPSVEKSSVSLSDVNNSKVISYTYINNEYVRDRIKLVENWLVNGSKSCEEGF